MTDAPLPKGEPGMGDAGPVPYVPPVQPDRAEPSTAFNPRRIVRPNAMTTAQLQQADVPAPYAAHPGWAGEVEPQPESARPGLLARLTPQRGVAPQTSSSPFKPFIAGFLFGVSLVLIVGRGWNTPEPEGPSWTLPSQMNETPAAAPPATTE